MISDLSLDEQLSYHIGTAARWSTALTVALQRAYKAMSGTSPDESVTDRFAEILERCEKALPASQVGALYGSEVADALSEARAANRMRDRLVHDVWEASDDDGVVRAVKFDIGDDEPKYPTLTAREARDVSDGLKRARYRALAIYWLEDMLRRDVRPPLLFEMQVQLLAGSFSIGPDGLAILGGTEPAER